MTSLCSYMFSVGLDKQCTSTYTKDSEFILSLDILCGVWDHMLPLISGDHLTNELQYKIIAKFFNAFAKLCSKESFQTVRLKNLHIIVRGVVIMLE